MRQQNSPGYPASQANPCEPSRVSRPVPPEQTSAGVEASAVQATYKPPSQPGRAVAAFAADVSELRRLGFIAKAGCVREADDVTLDAFAVVLAQSRAFRPNF